MYRLCFGFARAEGVQRNFNDKPDIVCEIIDRVVLDEGIEHLLSIKRTKNVTSKRTKM